MCKASPILAAMSGIPKNLYRIEGGVGAASSVKLINQLLAGVHIAAAAEAMAFGAKLGLDTLSLYEIIRNAAGGSWMFDNRVPAMLKADWTPHSALAIFVKDLVCSNLFQLRRPLVTDILLGNCARRIKTPLVPRNTKCRCSPIVLDGLFPRLGQRSRWRCCESMGVNDRCLRRSIRKIS